MRPVLILLLCCSINGFTQTHLLYKLKENSFSSEKKKICSDERRFNTWCTGKLE